MIRTKISEKKIESIIKKGATTPKPKKDIKIDDSNTIRNVQLRIPLELLRKIDELRAERKKKLFVCGSRHDFLLEAILKALSDGRETLKRC